jgi:hypothetical protein
MMVDVSKKSRFLSSLQITLSRGTLTLAVLGSALLLAGTLLAGGVEATASPAATGPAKHTHKQSHGALGWTRWKRRSLRPCAASMLD